MVLSLLLGPPPPPLFCDHPFLSSFRFTIFMFRHIVSLLVCFVLLGFASVSHPGDLCFALKQNKRNLGVSFAISLQKVLLWFASVSLRSEIWGHPTYYLQIRVDSFLFFAKYETVRNRSLFWEFHSFREAETKYEKSVSSCFAKQRNNVSFRIFVYFRYNFVHSLEFHNFYSSYSIFVPFIVLFKLYTFFRVAYLFNHSYPTPHPLPPLSTHTPHSHHLNS